jgi:methionyl-tRNA formyltransferase
VGPERFYADERLRKYALRLSVGLARRGGTHTLGGVQLTAVLVCEEGVGGRVLQLLVERGHRVASVFTGTGGRGYTASLIKRARSLGIPTRDAVEVRDPTTADFLQANRVDLLLNVHSLHIIDSAVLDAPRLGAYNLHPGPLPDRAGLHVPSWAVYEGADRHGVTLHRMTREVDAGTIAFADHFDIGPTDTGLSVMTQCIRRGIRLIGRMLELAERGEAIPAHAQDSARRRWFEAGPPQNGRLDWHCPARRIVDFVRACDYRPFPSPWGFPRTNAGDKDLSILSVSPLGRPAGLPPGTVVHTDGAAILVAAADAWVGVDKVSVDGRTMAAADAVRNGVRLH